MSNKMWGGRFAAGPDAIMEEINASIDFDQPSLPPGHRRVQGPCRHARGAGHHFARRMPGKIAHGLDTILAEIEAGKFTFKRALEDIHMNVESRLAELIGPAAGRLHTARSRNDQVATDFRLWVRDAIDALDGRSRPISARSPRRRWSMPATVMPGFTHLQTAQPVTFGHHLLAYVEMAGARPRPVRRCAGAAQRIPARRGGARRHVVPDRPRR